MRWLAKIAAVLFTLAVLPGCMSTGQAWTTYDKFTDKRQESVDVGTRSRLSRVQVGNSRPAYWFVHTSNVGESFHFLDVSLVFLADGQRIELRGDPDFVDTYVSQYGYSNTYKFDYRIRPEHIRAIGNAASAEARFYGSDGKAFPAETVTPISQAGFRKFYRLFVEREWDRMNEADREAATAAITKTTLDQW